MALLNAIADASAYKASPPPNEMATCLWIVYPLLQAMGYSPPEIHPQGSDSNGQFPDYTILPTHPASWFLEAKAWSIKLQDGHVQQALNYANTAGKRWVVLTNGKLWRLYDNHIKSIAADKLVVEVSLFDTAASHSLLEALSKTPYLSGALDGYARRARLHRVLSHALSDENSAVTKTLWNILRKECGLEGLSRAEVVASISVGARTSPESAEHSHPDGLGAGSNPGSGLEVPPVGSTVSLLYAVKNPAEAVTRRHPVAVRLPGSTWMPTKNWRELARTVVQWAVNQGPPPELPFRGGYTGHRFFLNVEPVHQSSPMLAHMEVTIGTSTVFMDAHRSARDLLGRAADVCNAVGIDPAQILLELQCQATSS